MILAAFLLKLSPGPVAATILLYVAILHLLVSPAAAQTRAEPGNRLLHKNDLSYVGAFRIPGGLNGVSTFEYGGTALAFNPARKSLFMVGHDWHQAIAEVSIPTIKAGAINKLATAKILQPLTNVAGRIPNNTLKDPGPDKVGGLLVAGNQLIGTLYEYYDGAGTTVDSHFTLASYDLKKAEVSGLFQVGQVGAGFVAGYMTAVPAEWQAKLGVSHLTGQATLPIIVRTSSGPALLGFNLTEVGTTPAPITPFLYYPLAHPLAPADTQNSRFNQSTQIRGVVFPEGTSSVLFFGSHGVGPLWYGDATEGRNHDPYRQHKGPHAPPYVYQVWAYDINELLAAKNTQKKAWEVLPYDIWSFELPYPERRKHIGGVAYDPIGQYIYLSQQFADQTLPVVHAFKITAMNSGHSALLTPPRR
jgi:hypothetical protein